MSTWIPICRIDEIPFLGARRVNRPRGAAVAIFRSTGDKLFALLDRCPHKGGPLSQGIVFGDSVACPLHNWTIGLEDGIAAAPDVGCTPVFALKVMEGEVHLDAKELDTLGTELPLPVAGPCRRPTAAEDGFQARAATCPPLDGVQATGGRPVLADECRPGGATPSE